MGQGPPKNSEFLLHILLNEKHSPEFKGFNADYTVTGQIQMNKAPWCATVPTEPVDGLLHSWVSLITPEKQISPKSEGKDTL